MLGGAGHTEFDLRFSLFGIPVRVHPIFWLCGAFLSWRGERVDLTAVGVLVVLISVLVHELGHAIFARLFGYPSEIVLYFFGGYATVQRQTTWKDITTLVAGPGFGLILYGCAYAVQYMAFKGQWFADMPLVWQQRLNYALFFMVWANLVWSLLNLVPILPLDGGQICRELCLWINPREGMKWALLISIVIAGIVAVYGLACIQNQQPMFGSVGAKMPTLFAGIMCYQNLQAYQSRQW